MNWIVGIALVLGLVVVLGIFLVLAGRRGGGGAVSGRFDFNGYKAGELARRGLHDKTKWH